MTNGKTASNPSPLLGKEGTQGRFNISLPNRSVRHLSVPLCLSGLLLLASCQDHHFVPMEKADKIKLPSARPAGAPAPGFPEGPQAQKQVMAEAQQQYEQRQEAAAKGQKGALIAEGRLELGTDQKKRDFTGWTIYVIVRNENLQGPPIAAVRYDAAKFPMGFRADTNDLMMGAPPSAGTKVRVEARLDKDGDPMTKAPGDVWGITVDPVALGSKTAAIVLNQDRR